MRKMGFLEPSAPPSSAAKDSYESFFAGDITEADTETLDSLFPACRGGRADYFRLILVMDLRVVLIKM
jgi:hypothetical protein